MSSARSSPQNFVGQMILAIGLVSILAQDLAGAQDVCAGSRGQLYVRGRNCRSYIQCNDSQSTEFACPNETFWNQAASKCDEPKNVASCGPDAKLLEAPTKPSQIKPAEMNSGDESNPETANGGETGDEDADETAEATTAIGGQSENGGHDEDGKEFLPALIGGLIRAGSAIGKAAKIGNRVNKANNAANKANCVRKNGVRNCARRSEAESAEAKATENGASEGASEVASPDTGVPSGVN